MRKSHRGSTIGRDGGQSRGCPSIDHGVQKFEGEGVKKYRNVIEKSYGSNTGNPAKEIKRASERKPKQEVIKALRLGKSEGLELQPRKGKANMRMELPKRRAPGGRVNREEANRITEELNRDTSPWKGYTPRESSAPLKREIAPKAAKPIRREVSYPTHSMSRKAIEKPNMRSVEEHRPSFLEDLLEEQGSHRALRADSQRAYMPKPSQKFLDMSEKARKRAEIMDVPPHYLRHARTAGIFSKGGKVDREKDLSFSEWAKEEKREHAHKPKKHRSGGRAHFDPHDFERDAEVPEERMAKTNLHTPHGRKKPYVNRSPSQDERDLSAGVHEKKRHTHEKELRRGGRAAGGHWIQGAIKHPGALHKTLGVPQGTKIPRKKLLKAEHSSNPLTRKRANLAMTLKGFHKK